MIEENVVSAAGSTNRFNAIEIQSIIKEAGFIPAEKKSEIREYMGKTKNLHLNAGFRRIF